MLIAESGATKTEWRLIKDGQQILSFRTSGFNPNVMTEELIRREMGHIFRKNLNKHHPSEIHFYGAGLRLESQQLVIKRVLEDLSPESKVFVAHDLIAAARSTGFFEGIVCILGTGSNSCYYLDGEIKEQKGGHGYLFGDEGSGADLGRQLVKGLLENRFPTAIKDFIESQEGINVEEIKLAIFRSDRPNVRMARLSKYLDEIVHYDAIKEMIQQRFEAFLESTVTQYPNHQSLPVSFIGSIAYYFRDILEEECRKKGINQIDIQHDPIERLIEFHVNKLASGSATA